MRCQTAYCIADRHLDGEHVDVTGTTWTEETDGDGEQHIVITHTYHDPWID